MSAEHGNGLFSSKPTYAKHGIYLFVAKQPIMAAARLYCEIQKSERRLIL